MIASILIIAWVDCQKPWSSSSQRSLVLTSLNIRHGGGHFFVARHPPSNLSKKAVMQADFLLLVDGKLR